MLTAAALTLAAGAVTVAAGQARGSAAAAAAPTPAGGGHQLDHVFVIMLENHEADHVIGDPAAPYLTSLASAYGQATDYFGVTHPSEPNYIAATSGEEGFGLAKLGYTSDSRQVHALWPLITRW